MPRNRRIINELAMAGQGHGYCSLAGGARCPHRRDNAMMRPLLDATREALMSLWRAMLLRSEPERPASGTGGAIG